jgi:hypothetical protein
MPSGEGSHQRAVEGAVHLRHREKPPLRVPNSSFCLVGGLLQIQEAQLHRGGAGEIVVHRWISRAAKPVLSTTPDHLVAVTMIAE